MQPPGIGPLPGPGPDVSHKTCFSLIRTGRIHAQRRVSARLALGNKDRTGQIADDLLRLLLAAEKIVDSCHLGRTLSPDPRPFPAESVTQAAFTGGLRQ